MLIGDLCVGDDGVGWADGKVWEEGGEEKDERGGSMLR